VIKLQIFSGRQSFFFLNFDFKIPLIYPSHP